MRRFVNTLFILMTLIVASSTTAQWSQLYSFNSQIFTVHFLSSVGRPDIGFVGTANGSVWRTTDKGITWTKTTTPINLTYPVSGFTFKDQNTGWLSARQTNLLTGIYKTTDGGLNWTATSQRGEQASVYYNPTSKAVIASSWSGRTSYSINDGTTWVPIPIATNQNNIAFISPLNGLMTSNSGNFYTTTDGGISWVSAPFKEPAWQPLALPTKGLYYIAPERRRQILRSSDGGIQWDIIHQFPPNVLITGDIKGDTNILYIQTTEEIQYSLDGGVTWERFCGPGNAFNTHFFLEGDTLYAGTVDGKLWWNPNGIKALASVLVFSEDTVTLSSPGCFTVDTIVKMFNVSDCLPMEILSVSVSGSPRFSITKKTLPDTLIGYDSVRIHYSPDDFLVDSGFVLVAYKVNNNIYEKKIYLRGNGAQGQNIQLPKTLDLLLTSDCNKIDTAITLINGPCDTLRIQSLAITSPSSFTITNASLFPRTLLPDESARIQIQVDGTIPGDYTATLTIRLSLGGIEKDTSVTLKLKVLSLKEPQAQLSSTKINFDSVTICTVAYDTIWFTNTVCKPLKLTGVSQVQSNPNYYIEYQPALPLSMASGEGNYIVVRYTPSTSATDLDKIKLTFEFDAASKRDTTIELKGAGKPECDASLSLDALSFEPILLCEQEEQTSYLRNFSCDSAEIVEIIGPTDNSFQILSPTLFTGIAPNDSVRIRITEVPTSDGEKSGTIRIRIRTKNGAERILTMQLFGTVKPKVHVMSMPAFIVKDSIAPCASFDTSFTLYNLGICDTLFLDNTTLFGPSWYTLIGGPLTPSLILPGDSAVFTVRFSPGSNAIGLGGLSIVGKNIDTTINITSSSKKGGSSFVLSADDSIFYAFLCKTASRTFTVGNYGCDTLLIDSLFLASNPQFSFNTSITLPIKVAPNADTNFIVNFDPSKSGDSSSILVIKSDASGISRSVPLHGSMIGTKGTVRFDVASIDNSAVITKPAGDVFTTRILVKDIVEPLRDLKNIEFEVHFFNNVLTVTNPAISPGWDFVNREDSIGLLRIKLSRKVATPINPNDEIAKVSFRVTIGDSSYSPITIANVKLNGSDSIYHSCVLEPLTLSGTILQVDDTCGDAFIRGYINHDGSIFDNMRIVPNPTNDEKGIVANFDLNLSGDVKMAIFDVNGKMVLSSDATFSKGRHTMSLPSSSLPQGQYLVGLESSGSRSMSRVLIVK